LGETNALGHHKYLGKCLAPTGKAGRVFHAGAPGRESQDNGAKLSAPQIYWQPNAGKGGKLLFY